MARLRLIAPSASEDEIHEGAKRTLDLLLLPPAVWTTMPAGGYGLTPAAADRLFRLGLKTGIPDILIWHFGAYGIELKTRTGVLTRTRIVRTSRGLREIIGQLEMHEKLRAAGVQVAVCRSPEAVLQQCRAWGLPLRAHEVAA